MQHDTDQFTELTEQHKLTMQDEFKMATEHLAGERNALMVALGLPPPTPNSIQQAVAPPPPLAPPPVVTVAPPVAVVPPPPPVVSVPPSPPPLLAAASAVPPQPMAAVPPPFSQNNPTTPTEHQMKIEKAQLMYKLFENQNATMANTTKNTCDAVESMTNKAFDAVENMTKKALDTMSELNTKQHHAFIVQSQTLSAALGLPPRTPTSHQQRLGTPMNAGDSWTQEPEKPVDAFTSYSNGWRHHLKKEHPNATDSIIDDMLCVAWGSASNETRDLYDQAYQVEMEQYHQDLAKWEKVRKDRNN